VCGFVSSSHRFFFSDAAFRVACLSYVNEEDDADVNARGVTRLTPKAVDDMFALLESENNS
jgi:hypothetical protein